MDPCVGGVRGGLEVKEVRAPWVPGLWMRLVLDRKLPDDASGLQAGFFWRFSQNRFFQALPGLDTTRRELGAGFGIVLGRRRGRWCRRESP